MKRFVFIFFISLIVTSCCEITREPLKITKKASSNPYDVFYIHTDNNHSGVDLTISNLQNKDVYAVISNISLNTNANNPDFDNNMTTTEIYREQMSQQAISTITYDLQTGRNSTITPLIDVVGQVNTFNILDNNNRNTTEVATCKVARVVGEKQLSIFVANSLLSKITQTMVEQLADNFMIEGDDNDIYDYETNILGEEWGPHNSSSMINQNNNITILLSDLPSSGSSSVTLGYFYTLNNFKKSEQKTSNERLMFHINGNYYAESGVISNPIQWSISHEQPQKIISTLTHELQHMIAFYQKIIKNNKNTNIYTWLNEMCSLAMEDIIASKMSIYGPRGRKDASCEKLKDFSRYNKNNVTRKGTSEYNLFLEESQIGRLSFFNHNLNEVPIYNWSTSSAISVNYYNSAFAFGAFLTRNYGGPKVIRDIVHSTDVNVNAIEKATKVSLDMLQRQWAVSCILSDMNNVQDGLKYNNGNNWFENEYNNTDYKLGSINLYNIYPPISYSYLTQNDNNILLASSNKFYKLGSNVTGTFNKNIKFENVVQLTIVVRDTN